MSLASKLFSANSKRWAYATWMSCERGYLYVENPKVGCTTIKQVLQRLARLPLPPNEQAIHYRDPPEKFVGSVLPHLDELDQLIDEGLFVFTFVRDPKWRLISAYKDKIVRARGPFWENYRREIRDVCELAEDAPISFSHFLRYVEGVPDTRRDPHWRSQVGLLRPDIIPYSFVGRFESFEKDLLEALRAFDVADDEISIQPTNSTAKVRIESSEFAGFDGRICALYAQDFERFGY